MRVVVTAVGPNNWGLADPIIQYLTTVGATIAEIQMYDHSHDDPPVSGPRFAHTAVDPASAARE